MHRKSFLLVLLLQILGMLSLGTHSWQLLRGGGRSLVMQSARSLTSSSVPVFDQTNPIERSKGKNSLRNTNQVRPANSPVILGIAGGSASGKTTLTKAIIRELGQEHVSFIGHDSYYKELHHLSLQERAEVNFDHPSALDTELLVKHLHQLKNGEVVNVPIYSFATHTRTPNTELVTPRRIIILDGILIFAEPQLLSLMDMKIFVDTEDDLRLIRRIKRDITERQRSIESVITQYTRTVRPMHLLYVEPSKRCADIIVPAGQGIQPVALDMCVSRLREIISVQE
jgi:uridine kinase